MPFSCCSSSVINCTVANNKRYGISSEYGSLQVVNSIVFYNTPNSIYSEVRNDITGHGDMNVTYSCTMNLIPGEDLALGLATINHAAPLFSADGKYMLLPNSPCIDAGNGDYAPLNDYAGNCRVDDPTMANFGKGTPAYSDLGYRETTDSDRDGMSDVWEMQYFGSLSHTGLVDSDNDGLSDVEEFNANTNPLNADSDGDGLKDGNELYGDGTHGDTDGLISSPMMGDTDGDGISDGEEVVAGADGYVTDPAQADTDMDGFLDGDEVIAGTDPNNPNKFFCIKSLKHDAGQRPVLSWDSIAGRVYSIYYSSNLLSGWTGVPGYTNIPGSGLSIDYTNSDSASSAGFYSIRVQRGP